MSMFQKIMALRYILLPKNGNSNVEVTTLSGTTIPAGEYDGTGKAILSAAEQAKVVGGNIIAGVTILGVDGTIPDNADADVEISDLAGTLIPTGRYDGTGRAKLTAAEAAKVVSGNLRSTVTLMGVPGDSNVVNTADANAVAGDIVSGKTAYVGGVKQTGTLFSVQAYMKNINAVFSGATLPTSVIMNCPNVAGTLLQAFLSATGMTSLDLTVSAITNMQQAFSGTQLQTVKITGTLSGCTSYQLAFSGSSSLHTINATLNFTAATAVANIFSSCFALVNVVFAASTLGIDMSMQNSNLLSDASIVSIANGLNSAASGKTLTLHATPYARCSALTVYVSGGVAYISDPGGGTPMTLAAFITGAGYKNWTLASA